MSMCCHGFMSMCDTTRIEPNPPITSMEKCASRKTYYSVDGEDYPCLMPVKLGTDPGTVVPAPDGVDAIGFVHSVNDPSPGATPAVAKRVLVQMSHKVVLCWSDMAVAIGADPADPAAWWPVHGEMMKTDILVEYA